MMDEEIEKLVVSVRADTSAFSRDVASMRRELDGPFAEGADRAGRVLSSSLARAVSDGKLGFSDLKASALAALTTIASASLRSLFSGGSENVGGASLIGSLFSGLPGRSTGGPVSGSRPYLVGENGPEVFVPPSSGGRIIASGSQQRDVRVTISLTTPRGSEPQAFASSSRQLARAVSRAISAGQL